MQTIPSGIAASDYQCVDFDTGMPPSNVWTPTVRETGVLELVTDQVRSVPNSLHSVVWAGAAGSVLQDIAYLTWSASGGIVSAVTVETDAYIKETYGGHPNGYVDFQCVTLGGTKACLSYRYPYGDIFSITFPKTGPAVPFCDVSPLISYQQWSRFELTLSNAGIATLNVNGTSVTCSTGAEISSGASSVQIGAESISGNWGEIDLDNLIAYVRR
jgi:hypothetical protein